MENISRALGFASLHLRTICTFTMTKLAVILLLVAVLGVVATSAANYPRPPPVRPIRPFIPPRPPHPRNRRDISEKPSVNTPKPLVHEPLRPGRPQIQILPATAPPPHN